MIEYFRMEEKTIYVPSVVLEGIHFPVVPGHYVKILRERDRAVMKMISFFQSLFTEKIVMVHRIIGIDTYAFLRYYLSTPQHTYDVHSRTDSQYISIKFP